jgi:hypothetical protein
MFVGAIAVALVAVGSVLSWPLFAVVRTRDGSSRAV